MPMTNSKSGFSASVALAAVATLILSAQVHADFMGCHTVTEFTPITDRGHLKAAAREMGMLLDDWKFRDNMYNYHTSSCRIPGATHYGRASDQPLPIRGALRAKGIRGDDVFAYQDEG